MNESLEVMVNVPTKTWWQKIDSYDLRLAMLLTAIVMLRGSADAVLWCGAAFAGFVLFVRMIAPEWRFIELDPETAETDFVSVVLHWLGVIGLWLGIGFYVWDPVEIKTVSYIIGLVIYGVSLVSAAFVHSWNTSEEDLNLLEEKLPK